MVGGFLGAGKTTTIGKLAAHYTAQGKTIALVTNDQAYNLVDTETLRGQGFQVGEVPGACFCCKFDDLLSTVDSLTEERIPDIIIAEPVGSCTDLVATVIEPMKQLFGDRFETGPLVVLLKPSHGKKILADSPQKGFSPKAAYIFLKQLEEADAIAINKADRLKPEDLAELKRLAKERFPEKEVFAMSARTAQGFEDFIAACEADPIDRAAMMEMDYETYAQGEAELGWLNCVVKASSAGEAFDLDTVVLSLVDAIGDKLTSTGAEIAHLKILGQTLQSSAVANRVSSDVPAELSLASEIKTNQAELLVNARVAIDPSDMESIVGAATVAVCSDLQIEGVVGEMQSFRPGKPEPTHRIQ